MVWKFSSALQRWKIIIADIVAVLLLLFAAILFAVKYIDFTAHPIEDAAMLMQYSKHFAEGYGIVWNIGEPPVDGATDFLFMLAVGGLVKMGMSLELATRFLGVVSHILTVEFIYLALRRAFNAPWLVALGTSLFVLVGPGFNYVAGYFGTTFFALFACLSWWAALAIIQNGENKRKSLSFALASIVTSLIRPEGVILTALMLLAIIFILGWKASRQTILYYVIVFVLIGTTYFLWRWSYFGYPLPNPYYVKGGGGLHFDSLKISYFTTFYLCVLLLPAFIVGLCFRKTIRRTIGFLIPIIGFSTAFILLSNAMNFLSRYQYVTLPLASVICWPITEGIQERFGVDYETTQDMKRRLFYILFTITLFSIAIKFNYDMSRVKFYPDGKLTVALMLSQYKNDGLRIATSESGLLPLYSQWRSLDTWGLNDQWIAHHGGITEDYLRSFNPDIIMFHAFYSPVVPVKNNSAWDAMTLGLKNYAEKNGYILAASYGDDPSATEYYYVRANLTETNQIVASIRGMVYYTGWTTGKPAINYALQIGK